MGPYKESSDWASKKDIPKTKSVTAFNYIMKIKLL